METGLVILDILLVILLMLGVYRHERRYLKEGQLGLFSYRIKGKAAAQQQGSDNPHA